ncbi:MAG: hypothetical protein Q4G36_05565 [Paracoccus sp. (in: a-proteobacteria)]|nr:hypothetical protein [Paracoccus sp. (in: a-proteobacteria)]
MSKHIADKSNAASPARLRAYLAQERAGLHARALVALWSRPRNKNAANHISQFARIERGRTA